MKKIFTPIFIFILVVGVCSSQQLAQYSLFSLNPYSFNAGYAGLENSLVVSATHRQQWLDWSGAPTTQQVNMHLPVYFLSSGVGIRFENDRIGAHRTSSLALTWSYQKVMGRTNLLSFGVSGVLVQYALDGSKLRTPDGQYEPGSSGQVQHNDPNLSEGSIQANAKAIESGVYFQNKWWEIGLSVQPVFSPKIKLANSGNLLLTLRPHFLGNISRKIFLANQVKLMPSMLLKTDGVVTQIDLVGNFFWRDNMMTGAAFRGLGKKSRNTVVIFAGTKLNEKTRVTYSFDLPLYLMRQLHRGSHEILLQYNLNQSIGAGKLPAAIYNPRFL